MPKLKAYFITGLIIVLPVLITLFVVVAILKFIDNILGKYINTLLGIHIFGLGILVFVIISLLIGMFAVNFLGKRIFPFFENLFIRIPLVHKIYPATKQMIKFLLSDKKQSFKSVVMVEYPRLGVYSIGFVTNEGLKQAQNRAEVELLSIFIPSTPSPLTGFFILAPRSEVKYLDISIEEGLKLIVSGGIVNP